MTIRTTKLLNFSSLKAKPTTRTPAEHRNALALCPTSAPGPNPTGTLALRQTSTPGPNPTGTPCPYPTGTLALDQTGVDPKGLQSCAISHNLPSMAIPTDSSPQIPTGSSAQRPGRTRVARGARRARRAPARAPRLAATAGAICLALCLAACGSTTSSSTGSFKGVEKKVAETISNFQSDATSLDDGKICKELLAEPVRKRLEAKGASCEKAIKTQLEEVDTFTVTVKSISVDGSSATAKVKSTVYGKEQAGTISLAKEKGNWLISDLS